MKMWDIVLLTEDRYYQPATTNSYINNILEDDAILTNALEALEIKVTRRSWSDASFDWSGTRFILVRTTWDYFDRFDEFVTWLNETSKKTQFINSIDLIKWNMDKHYLQDLQNKDVNIVETHFIPKKSDKNLVDYFNEFNLNEAVLKPAISGSARHTYRLNKNNVASYNSIFTTLISNEDMLLQPFQNNVVENGEIALMLMDGQFTHAVLKRSQPGDFRVQDDFGGTLHEYQPSSEEIHFAEKAVAVCPDKPLYARVDIIHDNNGKLAVMELEIIEPELWFRRFPPAANTLANAIKHLLN